MPTSGSRRMHALWKATLPILIVLTVGTALRLYNLNAQALRGDEAFTVLHWMREPLGQTIANIATVDPQGPLNYALYRAYGLIVGTSPSVVRFLPALASVMGIAAVYSLAKAMSTSRLVALVAAMLWTISPVAIYHAQDARSYALWAVANPLAVWLALRCLKHRRRIDWVLYIAAATIALYTYYLEAFTVIALNAAVLLHWLFQQERQRSRRRLVEWLASQAVIALLIAPWYLQGRLLSGGGYSGTTTVFRWEALFQSFLPALAFGEAPQLHLVIAAVLVVGVLVASTVTIWRWRGAVLMARLVFPLAVVVPVVALSIAATRLGIFAPRYILSTSVMLVVGVAFLIVGLRQPKLTPFAVIARVLSVLFVATFTLGYSIIVFDYAKSPDWRLLVDYLKPRLTSSSDLIIQAAADEAFTLYCLDAALTADCDRKLPANPRQSPDEIVGELTMRTPESRSVWYVANPPAAWNNATTARDWLLANLQPVRAARPGGLPAIQFLPWSVDPNTLPAEPIAIFPGVAALMDAQLWREPSDTLLLWLIWRPIQPTNQPLKVFAHLLTEGDIILAQDDQFPLNGPTYTRDWASDIPFRDIYEFRLSTPMANQTPTNARIALGWYDPNISRRLLTDLGDDRVIVTLTALP